MVAWFPLALLALFFFAAITLIQKHLLNQGIHPIIFGLYLMGFSFIAFLIAAIFMKQSFAVPKSWVFWLAILGIIALLGNLAATYSFQKVPNAGYTQAIISASAIVVLVASIFLFNSEFSWLQALGVMLTIIGVIIIGLK